MKVLLGLCFFIMGSTQLIAQIENPDTTVRFETVDDKFEKPEGLELPALKTPRLSNSKDKDPYSNNKYANLGLEQAKELDINKEDGFIDVRTNTAPKYFTKDKALKGEYGEDQYLGDIKTNSNFVNVLYRDHEFVDGDRIRVFVNGDIVQSNITLHGGFNGFTLKLDIGFNRIEFQALNQGSSGPNTAELHIYDDNEVLISANRWNLLTGRKATIIIVKE